MSSTRVGKLSRAVVVGAALLVGSVALTGIAQAGAVVDRAQAAPAAGGDLTVVLPANPSSLDRSRARPGSTTAPSTRSTTG